MADRRPPLASLPQAPQIFPAGIPKMQRKCFREGFRCWQRHPWRQRFRVQARLDRPWVSPLPEPARRTWPRLCETAPLRSRGRRPRRARPRPKAGLRPRGRPAPRPWPRQKARAACNRPSAFAARPRHAPSPWLRVAHRTCPPCRPPSAQYRRWRVLEITSAPHVPETRFDQWRKKTL